MADNTERVRQWRQSRKEHGLVARTIWLREETALRFDDMATLQRRTLSELVQDALDMYKSLEHSTVADTSQLRELVQEFVQEEMARLLPLEKSVTVPVAVRAQKQSTGETTEETTDYDPAKHILGPLCSNGHAYLDTEQSVRQRTGKHECVLCCRL